MAEKSVPHIYVGKSKLFHGTKFHYPQMNTFYPEDLLVNHVFTVVKNSINLTKLEKHASLEAPPKKSTLLRMVKLCHMKQFTTACTEKLTSAAWNTRGQSYL